jgi:hypothetical protein
MDSNPAGRTNNQTLSQSVRLALCFLRDPCVTSSNGSPVGRMSAMLGVPIAAKIRFVAGTSSPTFAV